LELTTLYCKFYGLVFLNSMFSLTFLFLIILLPSLFEINFFLYNLDDFLLLIFELKFFSFNLGFSILTQIYNCHNIFLRRFGFQRYVSNCNSFYIVKLWGSDCMKCNEKVFSLNFFLLHLLFLRKDGFSLDGYYWVLQKIWFVFSIIFQHINMIFPLLKYLPFINADFIDGFTGTWKIKLVIPCLVWFEFFIPDQ
jgi:hypothetical protein